MAVSTMLANVLDIGVYVTETLGDPEVIEGVALLGLGYIGYHRIADE